MKNKGFILAFSLAVALIIAFLLFSREDSVTKTATAGKLAPQFEMTDLQGRKVTLNDFRGKVVLVNFWATWCDTCKEESPLLQKLVNDQKGSSELAVIKILFRDSRKNAELYMKENKFTFTVLIDDKNAALDYGVTGVPETFMISKKGILKHKYIGPVRWDMPEARAVVSRMIAED